MIESNESGDESGDGDDFLRAFFDDELIDESVGMVEVDSSSSYSGATSSSPLYILGPPGVTEPWSPTGLESRRDYTRRVRASHICWLDPVWSGVGWRLTCDRVGLWELEIAYRPDSGELSARTWSRARSIIVAEFGFNRSEFHVRTCVARRREAILWWTRDGVLQEFKCDVCVWRPVFHKVIPSCTNFREAVRYAELDLTTCKVIHPDKTIGTMSDPWATPQ